MLLPFGMKLMNSGRWQKATPLPDRNQPVCTTGNSSGKINSIGQTAFINTPSYLRAGTCTTRAGFFFFALNSLDLALRKPYL